MLKVKTRDGNEYCFKFYHGEKTVKEIWDLFDIRIQACPDSVRMCTVVDVSTDGNMFFPGGISVCAPGDKFSKKIGRKMAMTDCLRWYTSGCELDKSDRKQIWEQYFREMK